MRDGLSQHDRSKRIRSVKPFTVIDSRIESLLKQAETIAGCIRYYDLSGQKDGYFDQIIQLLEEYRRNNREVVYDGNTEPSKALLITFLNQLQQVIDRFNKRWENYISWYMNDCLQLIPKKACPDSTWLTLTKNTTENIRIRENTGFTFDGDEASDPIIFRTTESVNVTNTTIEKAYSLHLDKCNDIYPANLFNIPTALIMRDLLSDGKTEELLFNEQVNPKYSQPTGLAISSPMLLLKEGKRFVAITFKAEQTAIRNIQHRRNLIHLLRKLQHDTASISRKDAKEVLLIKMFSDIFHLEISTPLGWNTIEKYVVQQNKAYANSKNLGFTLTFELHENFPSTHSCTIDIHQHQSNYPTLKILLNRDAWLYPYSWLKDFMIAAINIQVKALGIHNILFYNELGKVDNSIPFAPFGNNTEQGAWFAIGNYEMSMKNIQTTDIAISWQQLPPGEGGLFTHYQGYNENIDNRSFKLKARYLSDYKWKNTTANESMYLFSSITKNKDGSTAPQQKLADETILKNIPLDEMKPVYTTEEDYDYKISSKSGFFSFVLNKPEMGFGEKTYRRVFSNLLIKNARQKKKANQLNPPITPLVERITLSYKATEELDFRARRNDGHTLISHIYPLGIKPIYPAAENKPVPFVYSLDTDANILIGLKNFKGEEYINLFIDFHPQKKEIQSSQLPRVRWYWGDGYQWNILPDEAITRNTTKNLMASGKIKLYLPEIPRNDTHDPARIVWLRAGITKNELSISEIKNICTNAVKVCREPDSMHKKLPDGFTLNISEHSLPGIESVIQITPVEAGLPVENDTTKQMRVSEFITHRDRAVTARDYEQMTLLAFPQVGKVKCLPNINTKREKNVSQRMVTLVIVPLENKKDKHFRPHASTELLLDIESYFSTKTTAFVKEIDAINPIYQEIMVRCAIDFYMTEQSKAFLRTTIRKIINHIIAPWQRNGELPVFGHSFTIQQLYDTISELKFVKKISHISIVLLSQVNDNNKYNITEYNDINDHIRPTSPYAVLVPFKHHIIDANVTENFGIQEMGIQEHFVIWQNETEKH